MVVPKTKFLFRATEGILSALFRIPMNGTDSVSHGALEPQLLEEAKTESPAFDESTLEKCLSSTPAIPRVGNTNSPSGEDTADVLAETRTRQNRCAHVFLGRGRHRAPKLEDQRR
mmetsp:Transcript_12664/g.21519  ORF Transcript_12664/g.21519 Transcript_12664/m.21519 type:complete len:115 (-) Transcript_12664:134-478(-)